ncbi:MAG: LPS export ABC transporter permease LptF [Gammaproteobacteria bacterium]|nr:LPS export ABC transporter permease LptF [Gammaproteobacteria bacterium]
MEVSIFKQTYALIDSIIAKYLMRNVWVLTGAIFLVIFLVIFGNQVASMIKESLKHGISATDLLPLIGFNMVRDIPLMLSLSLFLAIILAISRLYKNSEAIVMNSLGVGDKHFMVFIQPVVLSIFIFILFLTTVAVPWTKQEREIILNRSDNASEFSFMKQKEFQKFKNGNIVFYASKVEDGDGDAQQKMEEVFIYTLVNGEPIITLAKQAKKYTDPVTGNTYLRLQDGKRYHGFPADANKRILNFDLYDLQIIDSSAVRPNTNFTKEESKGMLDLFYSNNPKDMAEFQWRLSQPLSIFILSFLGVLLGKASPRGGKNLGVLFGMIIFILYNNVLLIAKSSLEHGETPALIGLWWVHLLLSIFILLLYAYRHEKLSTMLRFFVK